MNPEDNPMKPRSTTRSDLGRRGFLASSVTAPFLAIMAATPRPAAARVGPTDFEYEITRTETEWRALLSKPEYFVLREGGTEVPHTSLNTFEMSEGEYRCKGCNLVNFDSKWKVPKFDIGWTFFSQARPTTVLTSIDEKGAAAEMADGDALIECHCRRCASHLGHILSIEDQTLFCLNGVALLFEAA
ncbi:peptide-methionine (R)-S-oxide reductase [Marivita sp.]|uniref:peptide-methionine (R)-S-oxide reductase n=1 Tax=Marivita sp. TaxID=2003365 RepID=UPI0025B8D2E6|nr:peptide-methionine (R)-S-oxide reductase [Marivita sp.]